MKNERQGRNKFDVIENNILFIIYFILFLLISISQIHMRVNIKELKQISTFCEVTEIFFQADYGFQNDTKHFCVSISPCGKLSLLLLLILSSPWSFLPTCCWKPLTTPCPWIFALGMGSLALVQCW